MKKYYIIIIALLLPTLGQRLYAQDPLQASFTHSIDRSSPLNVFFYDTSTPFSQITGWTWDFGDGSPVSNAKNPVHQYSFSGDYTIKLIAKRGTEQNSVSRKITVSTALKPIFTASPTAGLPPLSVNLNGTASTGTITSQSWVITPSTGFTYELGSSTTLQSRVKFTAVNVYKVKLKVSDGLTTVESAEQTITVKYQPVVDFDHDQPVYVGVPTRFTDRTQYPCVTGITQTWTFEGFGTGSGPTPTYAFTSTGNKDVKLCVTDGCGNSVCATKKVMVVPYSASVVAQFSADKYVVRKGQSITFTDESYSSGSATIKWWNWWFEAPSDWTSPNAPPGPYSFYTSDKATVTHTYNNAGKYRVRLLVGQTLTDLGVPDGPQHYVDKIIEVTETPEIKPGFTTPQPYTVAYPEDASISGDVFADLLRYGSPAFKQEIRVYKKAGATNSAAWNLKELYSTYTGSSTDPTMRIYNIKMKQGTMMVMKKSYAAPDDEPYSFQFFEGLGTTRTDLTPSPDDAIQSSKFTKPFGTPHFDFHNQEAVVVQAELGTGIFLYHLKQFYYWGYQWSRTSVTKTKIAEPGAGFPSKIFMDENNIVAHVNGQIFIFQKNASGVWDFSSKKVISPPSVPFDDMAYHNNTIIASARDYTCPTRSWPVAYIYERPAEGWIDNQPTTASFSLDLDTDVTDVKGVCQDYVNQVSLSDEFAAVRVALSNGTTAVQRRYVFKKWNDYWVSSYQTYKINNVGQNGLPSEISNYDMLNALDNGRVEVYNFENYCMLEPLTQTSFTVSGTKHDVIKGLINLSGGTYNASATITYKALDINLKPGITIKPGANVKFKAYTTCDDLYFQH